MIPAFIVSFLHLTSAIFMLYEARKKTDRLYWLRWNWACLPFVAISITFYNIGLYVPEAFDIIPTAFWSVGSLGLCLTLYWIDDIRRDIADRRNNNGQ